MARFSYGTTGDFYLLLNAHSQLDNLLATDRKVSMCISQCIPCTLNLARKNDIQLRLDQTGSCMHVFHHCPSSVEPSILIWILS